MKQAAKTLNYLTENNILQYADLQAKIAEVTAASDSTGDALKSTEKRLSDMALLIKNITTYQQTKPAYDGYRTARNKDKYRQEHESALILHEAAAKSLRSTRIGGKLPNVATLQAEYDHLTKEKERLYTEYGKLKKQMKQYGVIKSNVDSILKQPETVRKREKETEL